MNIFYLDPSPRLAAIYHCDKHIPKMILETCQLLFTKHWARVGYKPGIVIFPAGSKYKQEFDSCPKVYKPTHWNHPCALWVRQSDKHYSWLLELGKELLIEYKKRFHKSHACTGIINWMWANFNVDFHDEFIEPPKCMPDYCKLNDTVKSYQNYYIHEKSRFAKWDRTKRGIPKWYRQGLKSIMAAKALNGVFPDGISVTVSGNYIPGRGIH